MTDLTKLDATSLRNLIASGQASVLEVTEAFLARIAARDGAVKAWAWRDPEAARAKARTLDAAPVKGPLHGLPIGVKDVFDTGDMPTQQGSPLYAGHRPAIDAPCIATLRAAGALILGKTTTVEFAAMGHKAPTMNPHDPARGPGGTSSGSAAAVADRQVPLALGTQTSGSTIRPASFCGAYALKPTWNVVSREGVKMFSVTMDTVTWFGRSITDLGLLLDVFDVFDLPRPEPKPLSALRIGVCRTPVWNQASEAVRDAFESTVARLSRAGVQMEDLPLPSLFDSLPQANIQIALGEGRAAMLNEWRTRGEQLHPDYHKAFYSGAPYSVANLRDAEDRCAEGRMAFDRLAAPFDAVLTPSAADVAPLGLESTGSPAFNQMWSVLRTPCVNLPLPVDGLPIGITLTGPRYADRAVLAAAEALDRIVSD